MTQQEGMRLSQDVAKAITGNDYKAVLIADKRYVLFPPTIHQLAGACTCLAHLSDNLETLHDALMREENLMAAPKALSWLIQGNEELAQELSHGTLEELVTALMQAYQMVDTSPFQALSAMKKNMAMLIARPRSQATTRCSAR